MRSIVANRRHPIIGLALLILALIGVGSAYSVASSVGSADASTAADSQTQVEEGRRLFLEGCSSCHGLNAEGTSNGPTLIGAGAASVHFQVSTGRMPLAQPGAQAQAKPPIYDADQTAKMAAYVASLGPGPAIPTAEDLDYEGADLALGGLLYRTNCAQCHQAAGAGGALTQGKYAPSLMDATPQEIYEAMLTGPQNMPVFSDGTLPPESKKAIIKYIADMQEAPSPGGLSLGKLGPVPEGVFLFTAGLGALIAAAIWIGIKAR